MSTPKVITCTPLQLEILGKLSRSTSEKRRISERAELLVHFLENGNPSSLKAVKQFGKGMSYVKKWRDRWQVRQPGLSALEPASKPREYEQAVRSALDDEGRSGKPSTYTEEQVCLLYAIACQKPEDLGYPITDWTPRELRLELIGRNIVGDISESSVARFLKRGRPQAPPDRLLAQRQVR